MTFFELVYLFILVSFINFVTTKAQEDSGLLSSSCSFVNRTTPNSAYQLKVRTLLSYLSSNATTKQFYNTAVATGGNHSETVYGMFFCWGDVPPHLCTQCVANATKAIFSNSDSLYSDCSLSKEAVFWYEDCMIRFSNISFFSIADSSSPGASCHSAYNQTNLKSLFSKTINEAADEAANTAIGAKKYATKQTTISGFQTLYCEAQCTPDLSPQYCRKCLNATIAFSGKIICNGIMDGKTPSCNMRCDVYPFYRPSTAPAPKELITVTKFSDKFSQDAAYISHKCSGKETTNSFRSNLGTLLSSLNSNADTKTGFFNTAVHGGNPSSTVSGLFMCRGDLVSSTLCQQCVLNATQRISSECTSSKEAVIWYNHCLLRYWEGSSLSKLDTTPTYHHFNILNTSNPSQLQSFSTWILANTLSELKTITDDSIIKNYATKAVKLNDYQKLYTLAQCTADLSNADCRTCLNAIFQKEIPWCCMGSPEGKVLYPSCYITFGLSQFYRDEDQVGAYRPAIAAPLPTIAGNNTGKSQTIILIVVLSVSSLALLSFCCCLQRRKAKQRSHKIVLRKNFGPESMTLEGLHFDLTIIKAATDNFSHENKIGKGGFGEVYKGILHDGRYVAIKRLSTSSKQGSIEFKNEILLIAKLQHRNLVTLLGFCIEEDEKILIYEYMPNGSLDYLLFGTREQKLSWFQRYQIIRGTALGIHYLHEYSRLKVIHRDLKPSNILLDENMNPKISDFGMARIVEMDQDRGNTNRIAGTYGYLSPEYAMLGQFSEKSDVFSFGVIVLEIITGKKNLNIYESRNVVEGLMGYVWRQWNDQQPLSILDSSIKGSSFQMEEALKCIHIGLLCVQENQNVRPTMATIISYLNNHSFELPSPQEPAFFLHRHRINQGIVTQQELNSSEVVNGYTLFSINEMSSSNFYPR